MLVPSNANDEEKFIFQIASILEAKGHKMRLCLYEKWPIGHPAIMVRGVCTQCGGKNCHLPINMELHKQSGDHPHTCKGCADDLPPPFPYNPEWSEDYANKMAWS